MARERKTASRKLAPGIYQRRIKGWWYVQFYSGKKRPTQKTVALGTPYFDRACTLADDIHRRHLLGLFDPWSEKVRELTLGEATERYQEHRRREGIKAVTIKNTGYTLSLLAKKLPEGDVTPLSRVESTDIHKVVWKPGLRRSTQHTRYSSLHAFFAWLHEKEYVKQNIASSVKAPGMADKLPVFLSRAEYDRLLIALEHRYEETSHLAPRSLIWLKDVIELALYSGLRRAELARLTWDDVTFPVKEGQQVWLTVSDAVETPKWDSVGRLPLPAAAHDVLWRCWGLRSGKDGETVLKGARGGPINKKNASTLFKEIRELAGLPASITLHRLRDTYASWLVQSGVDLYRVKMLMRHKNISMTMAYAHLRPDHLTESVNKTFDVQ